VEALYAMIKRGWISSTNNSDRTAVQIVQNESFEFKAQMVEIIYPYGIHGSPPLHSLTVTFNIAGDEENQVAIAYKPDLRQMGLQPGEMTIGNFVTKSTLFWNNKGDCIEIVAGNKTENIGSVGGGQSYVLTVDELIINGNVTINGNFNVETEHTVTHGDTNIGQDHKHGQPDTGADAIVQGDTLDPIPTPP